MSEDISIQRGDEDSQNALVRCERFVWKHLDSLAKFSIYFIEFLGTFFLVITIGFVILDKSPSESNVALGPLAIGSVLMGSIFMGGHISGAHYNPAVTFGVYLTGRGKLSFAQTMGYFAAQLLGSFIAGLVYWHVESNTFLLAPSPTYTDGEAFTCEFLFTFLLVSVVLNTATSKSHSDNSFYGLAIGFTVMAGAVAVGDISGAAFNPAVGFGPIIADMMNNGSSRGSKMWIYWIAPLFGSLTASITFRITNHHKEYAKSNYSAIISGNENEQSLLRNQV